jgi:hypothetical protein
MTLSRLELIQDLLELYTGSDHDWYMSWLNAQTDHQLSELWKNAYGQK